MDSLNGVNGVECTLCQDSGRCESITLHCGHAYGRSCMRVSLEKYNQTNCHLCRKQLNDDDIKEIKKIPLQERVVTISKKTIKFICQVVCTYAPSFAPSTFAGFAAGATGVAGAGVAGAGFAAGSLVRVLSLSVVTVVWGAHFCKKTDGFASGVASGAAIGFALGNFEAVSMAAVSIVGTTANAAGNYLVRND